MTDKEFRRLKRSQLIDIIYHLKKEIEEQKKTIEDLQKQLEDRTIRIQKTKMFQYEGASRFAYNWALAREKENYEKVLI